MPFRARGLSPRGMRIADIAGQVTEILGERHAFGNCLALPHRFVQLSVTLSAASSVILRAPRSCSCGPSAPARRSDRRHPRECRLAVCARQVGDRPGTSTPISVTDRFARRAVCERNSPRPQCVPKGFVAKPLTRAQADEQDTFCLHSREIIQHDVEPGFSSRSPRLTTSRKLSFRRFIDFSEEPRKRAVGKCADGQHACFGLFRGRCSRYELEGMSLAGVHACSLTRSASQCSSAGIVRSDVVRIPTGARAPARPPGAHPGDLDDDDIREHHGDRPFPRPRLSGISRRIPRSVGNTPSSA